MIGYSELRSSIWAMLLLMGCLSAVPVFAQDEEGAAAASGEGEEGKDKPEGEGKEEKKKPKVAMRKVLEHKKQFVVYPRVGYVKVLGGGEGVESVNHGSVGFDLQIGVKQKVFFSLESHLLYISGGNYGLSYSGRNQTIEHYGEKDFTSLSGVGFGFFTSFLDKQEVWTHVGVKVGYLYPFFVPIWLGGDLEKEFRRTRGSYWVITAAPMAGVLLPLKEPVVSTNYEPVDPTQVVPGESSMKVRFMLGAHVSIAFVFAPRS